MSEKEIFLAVVSLLVVIVRICSGSHILLNYFPCERHWFIAKTKNFFMLFININIRKTKCSIQLYLLFHFAANNILFNFSDNKIPQTTRFHPNHKSHLGVFLLLCCNLSHNSIFRTFILLWLLVLDFRVFADHLLLIKCTLLLLLLVYKPNGLKWNGSEPRRKWWARNGCHKRQIMSFIFARQTIIIVNTWEATRKNVFWLVKILDRHRQMYYSGAEKREWAPHI